LERQFTFGEVEWQLGLEGHGPKAGH
jgi:hypothetical protein